MRPRRRRARRAAAFLLGAGGDALLGDPPNVLHPVRAVGLLARWYEARSRRATHQRIAGLAGAVGIPIASGVIATVFETARQSPGGRVVAAAATLALASAQSTLMRRALEVADALDAGDLDDARRLLGYHLVSRETGDLSAGEVAGATIESVAENLGDGVAGPWLAFALAGSGGAWAYRALNTLDSLWGYRSERYAEFGWAAARLDDLANLVPSRAAALAICVGASGERGIRSAFDAWRRDRGLTDSPNAGQPMAAMAGALGVTLTKRGHYALGAGFRDAGAGDIRAAVVVARRASLALAVLCLAVIAVRGR
ncbi:MAG: cobalamin biosynthesis protein CobD [Dehalococcoidia bacterium]|nr:MAG: cobalamin biosynthesis protein CobD [Dehalococcoidia bacterium]